MDSVLAASAGVLLDRVPSSMDDGDSGGTAALPLEAWALALQLTEDEDDGVRREVSAALGAAVSADDGAVRDEQVRLSLTRGLTALGGEIAQCACTFDLCCTLG